MENKNYFIGIDISSESFTVSVYSATDNKIITLEKNIPNTIDGFKNFTDWLHKQRIDKHTCIICMEATGIYGEALSYFLCSQGYSVAVEPPLKIKRAFKLSTHKNDKVDSQQIAQYCRRFTDELHYWSPKSEILEQINTLLTLREQFVTQVIANQNVLKNFQRRYVQTPLANSMVEKTIENLKENIKNIDKQINNLINKDTDYKQMVNLLKSIPGVGMFLAANLLVLTNGFQRTIDAKRIASYIGICPYEHTSGKSIKHKPRSKGFGPSVLRKLLHLASLSLRKHNDDSKKYFFRKVAEGKAKRLVLNNMANRLLKIICAVIRDKKPYIKNLVSINPVVLKTA
jgi:transposase